MIPFLFLLLPSHPISFFVYLFHLYYYVSSWESNHSWSFKKKIKIANKKSTDFISSKNNYEPLVFGLHWFLKMHSLLRKRPSEKYLHCYCHFRTGRRHLEMGLVRITSKSGHPNYSGSYFGLPPVQIYRMTGLGGMRKILWTMTCSRRPHPFRQFLSTSRSQLGISHELLFRKRPACDDRSRTKPGSSASAVEQARALCKRTWIVRFVIYCPKHSQPTHPSFEKHYVYKMASFWDDP